MLNVPKRFRRGKVPYNTPLPEFEGDPEAWLRRARATLDDILAAAEDAIRPLGRRQLGRVEHTRIIVESGCVLHDLLERVPKAARGEHGA